jgi:hypothetical protein
LYPINSPLAPCAVALARHRLHHNRDVGLVKIFHPGFFFGAFVVVKNFAGLA